MLSLHTDGSLYTYSDCSTGGRALGNYRGIGLGLGQWPLRLVISIESKRLALSMYQRIAASN